MVTTMLQRILINTSWTWVFSFSYLCLSILASLSPIESMQVVQFLIRKVSRVSHHLACFSSLRDMTDRVVCPDAVVVLLYMVFACLPSPVHVGLIFASVWVDAVHISQGRLCTSHEVSNTLSKCSVLVLRWVYIKCGGPECLSLLSFAIFASFLYNLYVTSSARKVHLTECLWDWMFCRSLESKVCV